MVKITGGATCQLCIVTKLGTGVIYVQKEQIWWNIYPWNIKIDIFNWFEYAKLTVKFNLTSLPKCMLSLMGDDLLYIL